MEVFVGGLRGFCSRLGSIQGETAMKGTRIPKRVKLKFYKIEREEEEEEEEEEGSERERGMKRR